MADGFIAWQHQKDVQIVKRQILAGRQVFEHATRPGPFLPDDPGDCAQVDLAKRKGLKISYIDNHMGAAIATLEFQEEMEKIAQENHIGISRYFGEREVPIVYDVPPEQKLARAISYLNTITNAGLYLLVCHLGTDDAEMQAFAGNVLELGSWDEYLGDMRILVMSATAQHVLHARKYARLYASVDAVLGVPVDIIERHGGGSVRCMLAEVFLR